MYPFPILILSSLIFPACGDNKKPEPTQIVCDGLPTAYDGQKWIFDLLQQDQECLAIPDEETRKSCFDMRDLSFNEGEFSMKKPSQESILVVEDAIDSLSVLRFRKRFKAVLEFRDGKLVHHNPTLSLPAKLIQLMKHFDTSEFESASSSETYAKSILETYGWIDNHFTGHNSAIVKALIEHNPKHPIVTLGGFIESDIFDKELLCQKPLNQENIRNRTDEHIHALRAVLHDFGVSYVNFSAGIIEETLRDRLNTTCGFKYSQADGALIAESMARIFEVFGASPNTLLIQAACLGSNCSVVDGDVQRYPHRVRAGFLNAPSTSLDEKGIDSQPDSFSKLVQRYRGKGSESDVFVNLGVDMFFHYGPDAFQSPGWLGFGLFQIENVPSTSNAAPLALSQVIYLRETLFPDRVFDSELITDLKSALTPQECSYLQMGGGRCVLQDPLKHKQAMVFKLGHR